jgi:hypothetical protein
MHRLTLRDVYAVRKKLMESGVACEAIALHPEAAAELNSAWPGLGVFKCEILTSPTLPRDAIFAGPLDEIRDMVAVPKP